MAPRAAASRTALAAFVAAALLLVLAPAAGAAERSVPFGFFGANWDKQIACCHATAPTQFKQWDRMARAGVESQRTLFNWAKAQPNPGDAFDFTESDYVMTLAAAHHIQVLPVVMQAPDWARRHYDKQPCNVDGANAPPKRTGPYTRYLRALVRRYGPNGSFWAENGALRKTAVHAWQIWNEPSECYQWTIPKSDDWAVGYGRLLRAAYKSVKQVDPSAKVVVAGLPNYSWKSLDHLYKAGGVKGYFDVAAVHPYTSAAHGPLTIVDYFHDVLREHGDKRIPTYVTETALPASKGKTSSRGPFETTDKGMASFLEETYKDMIKARKQLRIGRVYWYTWASDYAGWYFDFTGLVRYRHYASGEDIYEKPALYSYQKLARRAEGCTKDKYGACRSTR